MKPDTKSYVSRSSTPNLHLTVTGIDTALFISFTIYPTNSGSLIFYFIIKKTFNKQENEKN